MARDKLHEIVKNALLKDGWIITHDPLAIKREQVSIIVVDPITETIVTWHD